MGRWLEALFFEYSDCVSGPLKPVRPAAGAAGSARRRLAGGRPGGLAAWRCVCVCVSGFISRYDTELTEYDDDDKSLHSQ